MDAKVKREVCLAEKELQRWCSIGPGVRYRSRFSPRQTMLKIGAGSETLTGYSPEDIVADRVVAYTSLIEPSQAAALWKARQDADANQSAFQLSYDITDRDGKTHQIWELGETFVTDNEEKVTEGLLIDITSASLSLANRDCKERKFTRLVEQAPVGIVIVCKGVVTYVNTFLLETFGYSTSHEVLGRSAESFISQEDREIFRQELNNRQQSADREDTFEVVALRKDQVPITLNM